MTQCLCLSFSFVTNVSKGIHPLTVQMWDSCSGAEMSVWQREVRVEMSKCWSPTFHRVKLVVQHSKFRHFPSCGLSFVAVWREFSYELSLFPTMFVAAWNPFFFFLRTTHISSLETLKLILLFCFGVYFFTCTNVLHVFAGAFVSRLSLAVFLVCIRLILILSFYSVLPQLLWPNHWIIIEITQFVWVCQIGQTCHNLFYIVAVIL